MASRICTAKVSRAVKAAKAFTSGQSRRPYMVRKEILRGIAALKKHNSSHNGVCQACASLLDFKSLYDSFYHSGNELKRRKAAYKKAPDSIYYDVRKQNKFLLQSVFDSNGNYLFHRDCIRAAFGISNQRLARLKKSIQVQKGQPTEFIQKQDLDIRRHCDVVMPNDCEQSTNQWLESLSDNAEIECATHPTRHGNACKKSNNAKSDEVLQKFFQFVDANSASNGRKEGSHGKTFYFDRKFTQIRTPNKDDPQNEYKSKHSVLFEFNRTLAEEGLKPISTGTFHNWLKKYRPFVGICPSMSDYCDKCKEFEQEISRYQQIANRLCQCGHSSEGKVFFTVHAYVTQTFLNR